MHGWPQGLCSSSSEAQLRTWDYRVAGSSGWTGAGVSLARPCHSRLSAEIELGCSGLRPLGAGTPQSQLAQPPWAACASDPLAQGQPFPSAAPEPVSLGPADGPCLSGSLFSTTSPWVPGIWTITLLILQKMVPSLEESASYFTGEQVRWIAPTAHAKSTAPPDSSRQGWSRVPASEPGSATGRIGARPVSSLPGTSCPRKSIPFMLWKKWQQKHRDLLLSSRAASLFCRTVYKANPPNFYSYYSRKAPALPLYPGFKLRWSAIWLLNTLLQHLPKLTTLCTTG